MRFTWTFFLLATTALAAPQSFTKRATTSDKADVGYATLNGGTSGGAGGSVVTVTTLAELKTAIAGNDAKIVIIDGTITGDEVVRPGSNKTILGKSGATLQGVGIRVIKVSNVIIRNLKIQKVLGSSGDAIGIQASTQVWVDHTDLSSDRDHDKDFYDGLLDVTHGSTGVSLTWNKLSNHFKASLVGHSDKNGAQDKSITVTYANNYFSGLNSRTPSFRFGTGHIFNNFFENNSDGINTRLGAQLLVENNVWEGAKKALYSTDDGFAVERGNDFGSASHDASEGTFNTAPYEYDPVDASAVKTAVTAGAGATLDF